MSVSTVPMLAIKDKLLLKITHSGVCGTDEHCVHISVALGYEGISIVQEVGSNATSFKAGDRVCVGYAKKSCGYGVTDTGSFPSAVVCD